MMMSDSSKTDSAPSESQKKWTGNLHLGAKADLNVVLNQLTKAFNGSPYFSHNNMQMRVVNDEIEGYIEMKPYLIGNVAFQILHGGVAATLLDSIGGIVAMGELYKRAEPDQLPDTLKKVSRLATVVSRFNSRLIILFLAISTSYLNGKPNARISARPSSSVRAVVVIVISIPRIRSILSKSISGNIICSLRPIE